MNLKTQTSNLESRLRRRAALAALAALALAACGGKVAEDGLEFPKVKRKSLRGTGVVVDSRGKPINIPGAKVSVALYGQVGIGDRHTASPVIGPDGLYDAPLQEGKYTAEAWVELAFEGHQYRLFLDPLEGEKARKFVSEASDGVVNHFRWKIYGLRPGATNIADPTSSYGGQLRIAVKPVDRREASPPDDAELSITISPVGPMIDGSEAKPLTQSCTIAQLKAVGAWLDIPLGKWSASGTLMRSGGPKRKLKCVGPKGDPVDACEFFFKPEPNAIGYVEPASVVFLETED